MKIIKQANTNAIRTAHYPPCTYTLYLADRYGVMVILEANNESYTFTEQGPYALEGSTEHLVFSAAKQPEPAAANKTLVPGAFIVYQNSAGTDGQDIFNEKISGNQPFSVEVWASPESGLNDAVFASKGDTHFALKNESDGNLQFSLYTNRKWVSASAKQPQKNAAVKSAIPIDLQYKIC